MTEDQHSHRWWFDFALPQADETVRSITASPDRERIIIVTSHAVYEARRDAQIGLTMQMVHTPGSYF